MQQYPIQPTQIHEKLIEQLAADGSHEAVMAIRLPLHHTRATGFSADWSLHPVNAPAGVQAAIRRAVEAVKERYQVAWPWPGSSAQPF